MDRSVLNINVAGINISLFAKKSINESRKEKISAGIISGGHPDVVIDESYSLPDNIRPKHDDLSIDMKQGSLYHKDNRKIFRLKPAHLNPEIIAIFDRNMTKGRVYLSRPDYDWTERAGFTLIIMSSLMSLRQRFTFHACGIMDRNKGYLFLGRSGAGKTTMSKLWSKNGSTVIHDDQIIVYRKNSHFAMTSGNIFEKGKFGNIMALEEALLDSIFFLQHGRENILRKTNRLEAFRLMIKERFFLVWDKNAMRDMFYFYLDLVKTIPTNNLAFVPRSCCVDFIKRRKEAISYGREKAA